MNFEATQLLNAARDGHAEEIPDLLGEGANIEFKDRVRDLDWVR